MSDFVPVAEASSLPPGQGRTVHVRGREYALFNHEGQFYAVDNSCPHVGGPLGAGELVEGRLVCPFHGWNFDIKTGACISNPNRPVKTYKTRVIEGRVEIEVPQAGNPGREYGTGNSS